MKHIHLEQCHSTQDSLLEVNLDFFERYLISTNHQTRGRGRRDNQWEANESSLCFSMTLLPHKELTLTSAELSIIIAEFYDLKVKWPNDLINKKGEKCGGILIQKVHGFLIVGIGLNLYPSEFKKYDYKPGSIFEKPSSFSHQEESHKLANYIYKSRVLNVHKRWEKRCTHLDKKVSIIESDTVVTGLFIGIGKFGEALIKTNKKTLQIYNGSLRF
jgi:BirA family biotin operon repressor/biotin-[acetyl-CoA-carboxylase] ligase